MHAFFGFRLEDKIPDYTTLCRFRNEIMPKRHMRAY
ncbi:MAG: transposase [Flavobacteriales bacterium Tduv]